VTVLLPFYLDKVGVVSMPAYPMAIALYTLAIAFMLVSTIPTWSGKLLGERISRDMVLPILAGVALLLGLLWAYPYATVSSLVIGYLAAIPFGWRRYRERLQQEPAAVFDTPVGDAYPTERADPLRVPPGETKH
jgi:CDP-diacylglycerol---serine O-phosphatidyltransferase